MPKPLHSKKAYVFIIRKGQTNLMSFVTEYVVDESPQDVARAKVTGTDVVPGVVASSFTCRASMNILISEQENAWMGVFGDFSTDTNQIDIDFKTATDQLLGETGWHIIEEDMVVVLFALRDNLKVAQAQDMANLLKLAGTIWILSDTTVVGLRETARVGNFLEARLEVETGAWRKIINKRNLS